MNRHMPNLAEIVAAVAQYEGAAMVHVKHTRTCALIDADPPGECNCNRTVQLITVNEFADILRLSMNHKGTTK